MSPRADVRRGLAAALAASALALGASALARAQGQGQAADGGVGVARTFARDRERRALVCAHRGWTGPNLVERLAPRAATERAENSLEGLEATVAVGAAMIELDVRPTKDDALVLMHDATLDRTTDGAGPVADRTRAELDAVSLVPRGRIPSLREALRAARGRLVIDLDLKTGRMDLVAAAIQAEDALDAVIPSSGDPETLARLVALEPRLRVMPRARRREDVAPLLERFHPLLLEVEPELLVPDLVATIHAAGARPFVDALGLGDVRATLGGTPYDDLYRAGADVVQTDRPDLALDAARRADAARGLAAPPGRLGPF